MSAVRKILRRLLADEGGVTAIEYGLIVSLIAIACVGGMSALGGGAGAMWGDIQTQVAAAM